MLRLPVRRFCVALKHVTEVRERQEAIAQPEHRRLVDQHDPMVGLRRGADELHHADLRDGEPLGAAFDDKGGDDGQRQRNLDREDGARAGGRLDLDGAADLLDVRTHDVHADAAAGDVGHGLRRGETRPENQLVDVLGRHRFGFGDADQAVGDRLLTNFLRWQALAVVRNADDDMPAFVEGAQLDPTVLDLAGRPAALDRLQPVIARVADHVGQRILDQFEDLTIELRVGADHLEVDLLAEFVREIADDARQLVPRIADRLHARPHDAFLQFRGDVIEPLQRRCENAVLILAERLQKLIARQHEFGDGRHEVFEEIDADPDRLRRGGDVAAALLAGRPIVGGFRFDLRFDFPGRLRFRLRRRLDGDRRRRNRFGRRIEIERHALGFRESGQLGVNILGGGAEIEGLVFRIRGDVRNFVEGLRVGFRRRRAEVERVLVVDGSQIALIVAGFRRRNGRRLAVGHGVEGRNQVAIVAFRLRPGLFQDGERVLDAIERRQDERDRVRIRLKVAIPKLAEHVLRRVGDHFQARQPEEPAGALDRVNDPENAANDFGVAGIAFQLDRLRVEFAEAFCRFGDEFRYQIVHFAPAC